jgi:hypothetical protein
MGNTRPSKQSGECSNLCHFRGFRARFARIAVVPSPHDMLTPRLEIQARFEGPRNSQLHRSADSRAADGVPEFDSHDIRGFRARFGMACGINAKLVADILAWREYESFVLLIVKQAAERAVPLKIVPAT